MPKKKIVTDVIGPFHVTARCINKEWFNLPLDLVWEIFSNQLFFLHYAYSIDIHSFVLMNNHYHLLLSTPHLNLSEGMMYFQREVSRELNRYGNRINRTFAGRFFRSYISTNHYYLNCYKYVYCNPLVSKLVGRIEDYKYSSLSGLLGKTKLIFPVAEDHVLFRDESYDHNTLDWLNTLPKPEHIESIKNGLKHSQFKLRKDRYSRKPNSLEYDLL